MTNQELVHKYFQSWQEPADFEEMASYLSENFYIDGGFFKFTDRDSFIGFLSSNPTPWKEVKLLTSFFTEENAAILYEGTNTATAAKMRVSEHIRIAGGKITEIQTVIATLP